MAAYIEITYEISSTTSPTVVCARNKGGWIDSIRYGSVTGNVITLEGRGDSYTFPSTGVQKLYFFSSGTSVGPDAFGVANGSDYEGLPYLTGIKTDFPGNELTSLGERSFYFCSGLTSVSISNLTSLEQLCFYNCKSLQQITLPTNLTVISSELFVNCVSLTSVTFGPYITRIEDHAFTSLIYGGHMNLREIIRPANRSNITYIGPAAFAANPYLQNVNNILDDGLTAIESQTFTGDSSISSLVIPDSVSAIGSVAFYECSGLTEVYFGSGLTELSTSSFRGCSSLSSITATSKNVQTVDSTSFRDVHTGGTLYYPEGYESEYGSNGWLSDDQYYLGYYDWNGVATGDTPTPSGEVSFVSSAVTGQLGFHEDVGFVFDVVGCTLDRSQPVSIVHISGDNVIKTQSVWISEDSGIWPPEPGVHGVNGKPGIILDLYDNETLSDREETFSITVLDTNNNSYTLTGKVIQYWAIYTRCELDPSDIWWDERHPENSGGFRTYMTISAINCTLVDVASASIEPITGSVDYPGSWSTLPVSSVTFHNQTAATVYYDCPANDDDERRWCNVGVVFNTNPAPRYEYSGISYQRWSMPLYQAAGSGDTPTPSGRWMVLSEEEAKIPETESRYNFYVEASGCSIDSSHTPTISFKSADNQSTITWLNQGRATFDANNSRWEIEYHADENTGVERYANIVIDGVYDMDGNVYNSNPQAGDASSLIYYVTQYEGTPTPSDAYIRFVDTAITLTGSYVSAALEVSGCTSISDYCTYTGTGAIDFTTIYQFYDSCTINANPNTGSTQLESDLRVEFMDTDGNVYYDTIHVIQPVQVNAYFDPASISVSPGATTASTTAVGLNCTVASVAFDRIYWSGGTWAVDPTFTINGTEVTFQVPENTTNQFRYVIYYFTITDTDGNTYTGQFYLGQYDMRVYLDPYEIEFVASANTKGNNLKVLPSGTTIDSSYTPTYVSSADWLHVDRHMWSELNSGWTIFYGPDRNTTNQTREGYITVNGVHDTYGVVYDGLVCHVTQYSGSYVFANYVSSVSSAETDTTVEIVGVNTNICSVTVSGFTGHPADRWEGFEQPSYTQLGNYITVHIPENDVTGRSRTVQFSAVTIYGESCENTEVLRVIINQAKSGATPTPVQKDIKAADTSYSVGSGSGNASTTVQTTGCTYDHFTYITGGSFSVTATSGPNNTILFYYPENPTTSPRTGYVYITFYDGDGNSYGPQTISFTQQAGSSPGPGPGPDPETGYVLTTLTISDQEQHRYFVEARPGVVYSAAGQYYKTIPACEARYSLYYVNSYGGVDVLPFKGGGQKKTDNITRFNYSRSFRNNTPEFENVNYMNEIKAVWELQTGWIGDDGSSRMHELVESTIVYLYDAEEKTYTPVVMTDKKLEYKTYRNQGRKFYNYTVNVEESQSKERR